ncbi:MAG TPA: terminase family protein [Casimicrobiaceae bacterium]|nr:terminase family protein [Casimicrobiaceae bacterium]
MSSTVERTVRLAAPHPAQAQIIAEAARFNVVALGRRAGKSKLAQRLLIRCALAQRPGAYFAPTYKLLEEFWRELKAVVAEVIVDKSEQEHRLELYGGGVLECWSTDTGDPARGRRYALAVVDEAAMIAHLADVWGQAIRPTLTDFRGDGWFMSTPRGLNDFYTLFTRGQDPLETDWRAWQMPTSVNPFISAAEIESARHELPERTFAQEYLAQFLSLEGAGVFRGVRAVSRLKPRPPERGHVYTFGCDWGRSNDFTVISVVDATTMEQVAMDRFTDLDFEVQTERLHEWVGVYHPTQIVAERNSMGGPLVERLQRGYARLIGKPRAALPVYGWHNDNASKAAAIERLALNIERGELTLLDDQVQQAELLAFESTKTATGMIRYAAPSGMHDDTVIALCLANLGAAVDVAPRRSTYSFSR